MSEQAVLPSLPPDPDALVRELSSRELPEDLLRTLLPIRDTPLPRFNLELIRHTLGFLAQPQLADRSRREYLLELRRFFLHRGIDLEVVAAEELARATDRTALIGYLNYLATSPRKDVPVSSSLIDPKTATRRNSFRRSAPLSKATLRRRLAVLRGWLDYLVSSEVLAKNPARGIKLKVREVDRQRTPALSTREVKQILDALERAEGLAGRRDRALIRMGLWLGLRRAELVSLRVSSLDQVGTLHRVIFGGKGGKMHRRTLPDAVLHPLMDYLADRAEQAPNLAAGVSLPGSAPLFARHGRARTAAEEPAPLLSTTQVYRILEGWVERSGVAEARRRRGAAGISPHSLRATHITFALRKYPLHVVQAAVGHANPATTFGYRDDRDAAKDDPSLGLDFAEEL